MKLQICKKGIVPQEGVEPPTKALGELCSIL